MYKTEHYGFGSARAEGMYVRDSTGAEVFNMGGKHINRPVLIPRMVDDARFVPFGDPDVPPVVRQQRLRAMLGGHGQKTSEQINSHIQAAREAAKLEQAYQPQLLNPNRPDDVDQLGDLRFATPVFKIVEPTDDEKRAKYAALFANQSNQQGRGYGVTFP